jgi:hypothetical protein
MSARTVAKECGMQQNQRWASRPWNMTLEETTYDDRLDFDLSTAHCWTDDGLEKERFDGICASSMAD